MARRDVTVALSGDGGDELFGGYNRHNWGVRAWNRVESMPLRLRQVLGGAMSSLPGPALDRFFGAAASLLSPKRALFSPGDRIHKLARLITARDAAELYRRTVTHWATTPLVHRANVPDPWELAPDEGAGLAERMMATDFSGYLPDDVLVKLDRASMAVSLESRVPFLDHTLIEFAQRLPLRMKIRDGQGKWVLRQVLAKYVPEDMFERPKMGFALPIDAWLRGPLRDWAEDLLATQRLEQHGLLDVRVVRQCWDEHVRLGRQHQAQLWGVLMFQAWHAEIFR
jgi:asparagine synthase (glutamine-hydrolysing)